MQAEAAGGDRREANGVHQPLAHPAEQQRARLQIVILDFRIERVPELFQQPAQQLQPLQKAREFLAMSARFGQPDGQLQIFRSLRQALLARSTTWR